MIKKIRNTLTQIQDKINAAQDQIEFKREK